MSLMEPVPTSLLQWPLTARPEKDVKSLHPKSLATSRLSGKRFVFTTRGLIANTASVTFLEQRGLLKSISW